MSDMYIKYALNFFRTVPTAVKLYLYYRIYTRILVIYSLAGARGRKIMSSYKNIIKLNNRIKRKNDIWTSPLNFRLYTEM